MDVPPEGLFADKDHSPALGDKNIAEMGSQKTGAPVPTARFEFMLSCRSSGPRRNAIGVRVCASNAIIAEAFSGHDLGIIQIAPVNYDGMLQVLAETVEAKVGEFFPLREDQQSIGAVGRLISGAGEGDAERLLPGRAPWPWIVGRDLAALLYKRPTRKNWRRFADIVGTSLEGEAEHAAPSPTELALDVGLQLQEENPHNLKLAPECLAGLLRAGQLINS